MKLITLFFFTAIISLPASGQKKIASINLTADVVFATVDRPGELYVITRLGQLQKFDVNGKLLKLYKDDPIPTLFDPRDGARLFAFYRNDRHYAFLNPSFEVTAAYSIDSSFVIAPWLACVSGDHNLWVLDGADNTLKKINVQTSTVDVDVRISPKQVQDMSSITFMREYQGFVFLLDRDHGIHVFNGIGQWIKTISISNLPYFNFIGEELYYPEAGKLKFFNLFTAESRVIVGKPGQFVLLTDERIFTAQDTQLEFYAVGQ